MQLLELQALPLFARCIEGARHCLALKDREGFTVAVRLAQSQAVDETLVNRLLDQALTHFPGDQVVKLLDTAAELKEAE